MRKTWIGALADDSLAPHWPRWGGLAPLWALLMLAASGCVSLPKHVDKSHTEALDDPEKTSLGHIAEAEETGRNLSGIRLLSSGEEALASLIALADHAERTLDIQYYIIQQDDSARVLLHHVRQAADRGVRVRILVDDLNTAGEDPRFMRLGQHENVEVRVFNPFREEDSPPGPASLRRPTTFRGSITACTINCSLPTMLWPSRGAATSVISTSPWTRKAISSIWMWWRRAPSCRNCPPPSMPFGTVSMLTRSRRWRRPRNPSLLPQRPAETEPADGSNWLSHELEVRDLQLTWVPATVLADGPAKIASETSPEEEVTIANNVSTLMSSAKQELIVISPYFIPGKEGVALMRSLVNQGVHIRILTNSLASTDSPLVHTGYSRYRVQLLKLGIELSEVRPKLGQKRARFHPFRGSNASLHAKALVIDQRTVFIGSMNMDARSAPHQQRTGIGDPQHRDRAAGDQSAR